LSRGKIIVFIICIVLGGLLLWGLFARAASSESLPAVAGTLSPTPLPTATAQPCASTAVVHWASGWRRAAARSWKQWTRARSAFGLRVVPFKALSARAPGRGEPKSVWMDRGSGWKHDRSVYRARTARLVTQMKHPGGSGATRWQPLALWVGWPRSCLPMLTYIIDRESGGCPTAKNPSSSASGLLQFLSSWWAGKWNPFDPLENLHHGYHAWQEVGFQPWSL
jgi:hypothetical protein